MEKGTLSQLDAAKREISYLKSELNKIDAEKRRWFKDKENTNEEIKALIKKINTVKNEKDSFNKRLQQLKTKRDNYNDQVKKLIKELKELDKEKDKAFKKHRIRFDPNQVKERIIKLEEKIETDVVSFRKEKEIMKEIKRLKKLYEDGSVVRSILEKIDVILKEIENTKKKAEEAHKELQRYTKENKLGYAEFIEISKKVNDLRKKQEKEFKTFLKFRRKFGKVNKVLKEKLLKAKSLNEEISNQKRLNDDKKKQADEKLLKEKAKLVEEKLKKTKKLTTEDLLVLQGQK